MGSRIAPPSVSGQPDTVEVIEKGGEWFVRIVENAVETKSMSFELEAFAVSFAEGQCIRLGIADFKRV